MWIGRFIAWMGRVHKAQGGCLGCLFYALIFTPLVLLGSLLYPLSERLSRELMLAGFSSYLWCMQKVGKLPPDS